MGAAASGLGWSWAAAACGRRRRPVGSAAGAGEGRPAAQGLGCRAASARAPLKEEAGQEDTRSPWIPQLQAASASAPPEEETEQEDGAEGAAEAPGDSPASACAPPEPPEEKDGAEGAAEAPRAGGPGFKDPQQRRWAPGSLVERLLDDISDIWLGAVVLAAHEGDLYDVEYPDDGSVERGVEGCELRRRNFRMDVPAEVWVYAARCLYQPKDLFAFEALARSPQAAVQREAKRLWCTAYHERFSRCGPRCAFVRSSGNGADAAAAVAECVASADLGLTPVDRTPWKRRFFDQERFNSPSWRDGAAADAASPGDAAYGVSGKKLRHGALDGRMRFGANAMAGWYYDPRLGRMVRDC